MALPSIALPGQFLGLVSNYIPGPGTHIHDAKVYASIAGPVLSKTSTSSTASKSSNDAKSKTTPLLLLSIARASSIPTSDHSLRDPSGLSGGEIPILPEVGSIVLARVTRLGARFASIEILVTADIVCDMPFAGMIRREDIRATEKDKVKVEESFRPGDVIRGEVISLGDQSGYYVSTARNELGVVISWGGEEGDLRMLEPVSWREVRDPVTGVRESRKVAKPF